jgi:DNA-binding PadR family transcriptional regulator
VTRDDPAPDTLLPLPQATFHILMALADEDRHGYAIIQDIAKRTGGAVKIGAGTLYRSIQRMLEDGLLTEIDERPAPDEDDERRRYYRITPFGRAVARAEARRLAGLVRLARASGFAPRRASDHAPPSPAAATLSGVLSSGVRRRNPASVHAAAT